MGAHAQRVLVPGIGSVVKPGYHTRIYASLLATALVALILVAPSLWEGPCPAAAVTGGQLTCWCVIEALLTS